MNNYLGRLAARAATGHPAPSSAPREMQDPFSDLAVADPLVPPATGTVDAQTQSTDGSRAGLQVIAEVVASSLETIHPVFPGVARPPREEGVASASLTAVQLPVPSPPGEASPKGRTAVVPSLAFTESLPPILPKQDSDVPGPIATPLRRVPMSPSRDIPASTSTKDDVSGPPTTRGDDVAPPIDRPADHLAVADRFMAGILGRRVEASAPLPSPALHGQAATQPLRRSDGSPPASAAPPPTRGSTVTIGRITVEVGSPQVPVPPSGGAVRVIRGGAEGAAGIPSPRSFGLGQL